VKASENAPEEMRMKLALACALLALAALPLAACGGGGGPAPRVAPTSGGVSPSAPSTQLLVVRYDLNGDTNPDVLTLDTTEAPYTIVEALEGTADGDAVDATEAWKDRQIDPVLSEALAGYVAGSFEVTHETDLEVTIDGRPATVTVIE